MFFRPVFCIVKIQDSLAFHPYQLGHQATCISYFFSLPKVAQKISHFRTFSLGPPFAFWPKTAVFDTLGKIAISRLIDVFPPGFLHSHNLLQFSFPSIPIRLLGDLYFLFFQPSEVCSEVCPKNQPFSNIFPQSPLCILAKNRGFRYLGKNCHFSSNRCFSARFFAQSKSDSCISNEVSRLSIFPPGFLHSQNVGQFIFFQPFRSLPIRRNQPYFELFSLGPPICQPSEAVFAQKISHFRLTFSLGPPFAFFAKSTQDSLAFHPYLGATCISYFFSLPKFAQKISHFLPWSPLCILAKNRGFRYLGKNCHFF